MSSPWTRAKAFLLLTCILNIPLSSQANVSIAVEEDPPSHWYTYESFTITPDDIWEPFWAHTDVPHSLPLRGYIQESRNQFLDFGALEWVNTWVDEVYEWPVSEHDKEFLEDAALDQLAHLFETMTARFSKPHTETDTLRGFAALDYVKGFQPPYQGFLPLIVMYGLDETYDNANMSEWVIHPDVINETLNEAFPLVEWETELYWFDYDNATEFADLMAEKTSNNRIMVDEDYLTRCDEIIHNVISSDPRYGDYDLVLPSLVLVQEYTLYAVQYGMAVGGLGRLHSDYPEIDSWSLNGRGPTSYFYAGDPDTPRASMTPTVIHEICHCIGQTDLATVFGWASAATTPSLMSYYGTALVFDKLDEDLIRNGQVLQLWGRYLDEIAYFESLSLNQTQLDSLSHLETTLLEVPELLISGYMDTLRSVLYNADSLCEQLSSEATIPRKSDNWTASSPPLDLQVDWIIGPGIPNAAVLASELTLMTEANRNLVLFVNTTLPEPHYNLNISVHVTDDSYNTALTNAFRSSMVESNTSFYDPELVPEDAWSTWPRNRIFQNRSGYAIEGQIAEQWLTDNPFTLEDENRLHYRFYIFNLENLTLDVTTTATDTTANPIPLDTSLALLVVSGIATVVLVALVVYAKRR
ncbi:MAG: hypothetical protein JSW61_14115 [Candidatus Thorarchaeota archaeon]|nr:MAG: hypothetical protein JSW61_14115 [Candidatus Thorarchaeota archaeon]